MSRIKLLAAVNARIDEAPDLRRFAEMDVSQHANFAKGVDRLAADLATVEAYHRAEEEQDPERWDMCD